MRHLRDAIFVAPLATTSFAHQHVGCRGLVLAAQPSVTDHAVSCVVGIIVGAVRLEIFFELGVLTQINGVLLANSNRQFFIRPVLVSVGILISDGTYGIAHGALGVVDWRVMSSGLFGSTALAWVAGFAPTDAPTLIPIALIVFIAATASD